MQKSNSAVIELSDEELAAVSGGDRLDTLIKVGRVINETAEKVKNAVMDLFT